jgi:ATPase subunit of ABC transporter with duplicated ATPase domains
MPPQHTVTLSHLTFIHESANTPLFEDFNATFTSGFTGIVGANGAGKTTLLRLICGELVPSDGTITSNVDTFYCEQRTDRPPEALMDFLNDWNADAVELRGHFGVPDTHPDRWSSLSHGERKRIQIAHALWHKPDVLAIDEPTNHLDSEARKQLIDGLVRFDGTGFIVSHDRGLLDELCQQCVWIEHPLIELRTGGYTASANQRQIENESLKNARDHLVRTQRKLRKETQRRRVTASAEHHIRSKRGLSKNDSDARDRINRARNTDSKAGATLRQLDGRSKQLHEKLAGLKINKPHNTGIWLPGSRSSRNALLELAPGGLALNADRRLNWPYLHLGTTDRICLSGPNGAGKSTFLNHILALLNAPKDRIVHIPQELPSTQANRLLKEVKTQSKVSLGALMNVVSRLNSRPASLLNSRLPSPGEARKLMLALGMQRQPHIILMDEPTNHLDLPSIEALQSALEECPCALILVSHDAHLVDAIGMKTWQFTQSQGGETHIVLEH